MFIFGDLSLYRLYKTYMDMYIIWALFKRSLAQVRTAVTMCLSSLFLLNGALSKQTQDMKRLVP